MPPAYSKILMEDRANKFTGEKIRIYMREMINTLSNPTTIPLFAQKYNWNVISCVENGIIKSIGKIHKDIYGVVKKIVLGSKQE